MNEPPVITPQLLNIDVSVIRAPLGEFVQLKFSSGNHQTSIAFTAEEAARIGPQISAGLVNASVDIIARKHTGIITPPGAKL